MTGTRTIHTGTLTGGPDLLVETESTVNIPLLRKAVEWAEAEAALGAASAWVQSGWVTNGVSCGTAYCIAGWVLHEAGWTNDQLDDTSFYGGVAIARAAATRLGIDPDLWLREEDEHLFGENNTIEDVRRIAEALAGEPL